MSKEYKTTHWPWNPDKMVPIRFSKDRGGQRFKLIDHRYEVDGIPVHIWRSGVGCYSIQVRGKRDGALSFVAAKRRAALMVRHGT